MGMFRRGLGYLFRDFCSWTTSHGLPHVGHSNSIILKLFWIAVMAGCTACFVLQFQFLMRKYFSYTINTEVKVVYEELPFPVVTVCNLNPWKRNRTVEKSDYAARLMDAYLSYETNAEFGFTGEQTMLRQQRAARLMTMANNHFLDVSDATRNESGQMEPDISYSIEELVASCNFDSDKCYPGMLTRVRDPVYGYCLQFNRNDAWGTYRVGPIFGLRLAIRTDQATYFPWVESSGILVTVHNQSDPAFPDVMGYAAGPGNAVSYGIRYVSTTRQPPPYGPCSMRTDVKMSHYEGVYQEEACYRSCIQDEIIKQCGCFFAGLPYGQGSKDVDCFEAAGKGNYAEISRKMNCIESVMDTNRFNVLSSCDCPEMCHERRYNVAPSTSGWPAFTYQHLDCRETNHSGQPWMKGRKGNDTKACLRWFEKNTVFIEVYYERMNYQTVTESPAYELTQMLGELGGQVGLFLGMSIITALEFFTLIVLFVYYVVSHQSRKIELDQIEEYVRDAEVALAKSRAEKKMAQVARLRELYVDDEEDPPLPPKISQAE